MHEHTHTHTNSAHTHSQADKSNESECMFQMERNQTTKWREIGGRDSCQLEIVLPFIYCRTSAGWISSNPGQNMKCRYLYQDSRFYIHTHTHTKRQKLVVESRGIKIGPNYIMHGTTFIWWEFGYKKMLDHSCVCGYVVCVCVHKTEKRLEPSQA